MSTEPFDSDVPTQPRDRREHGGASIRPNDELALRTHRERVETGLQPYESEDVPPAADATLPYDLTATDTRDLPGDRGHRRPAGGRDLPLSKDNPFPPTRYAEQ